MRRIGHFVTTFIAFMALSVWGTAYSVAAPEQAHAVAPAAAAAPAPAAHVAEAPHAQPAHAAAQAEPAHQSVAPRSVTNNVHSNASDRRENHDDRNRNLNNGVFGYAGYGYGYYPYIPAYDYWNPYYNNNYNGATYPGQFTQPDTAINEPDQSANQTLSEQVIPQAATPEPVAPETTSAALNSALMASSQWRDADAQVRDAQSEYDAASAIVLAQLRTHPEYQQALARKEADEQKINAIDKKNPTPPLARTAPAAAAKLTAAQTVTQMETAAIASDPRASAAKAKLDKAVTNRLEIRRQIESTLPAPPHATAAPR